jgi:hypothetical protein
MMVVRCGLTGMSFRFLVRIHRIGSLQPWQKSSPS